MNGETPSQKGLLQPHVHYSFLKTASEGLSQEESDSESLAQEREYQAELQRRIHKTEKMVNRSYDDGEEESLEEDSLEEKYFSGEESDPDNLLISNGIPCGEENRINRSGKDYIADKYSELRYNPNWRKDRERTSLISSGESYQGEVDNSPTVPLRSASSPPPLGPTYRTPQGQEMPQNEPPGFDSESLDRCSPLGRVGAFGALNKEQQWMVCPCNSSPRMDSDSYSPHTKEYKKKPGTDFVEKNKLTLGLAGWQKPSYLQLHSKKQKGDNPEQAHLGTTTSSQAASLEENTFSETSLQSLLDTQAKLRNQKDQGHNVLEFQNPCVSSNSYREGTDWEQENQCPLLHTLSPNPSFAPLHPSIARCSTWGHQHPTDPSYSVPPNGKQQSMTVTFARNSLELNPDPHFPGLPLPCAGGEKRQSQRPIKSIPGPSHRPPYRCTVSEPPSTTRHGKHQKVVGRKSFSPRYKAGFPPPVNGDVSPGNPQQIYTEKISGSHVSGNSGPPQPPAHRLIQARSPTAHLIQAAERHHLEVSRLADGYLTGSQLAGMFPPIMQRGESDSRLDLESCGGGQPGLSRSNSEGCLFQMEKEKKEKEKRQSYRSKGYMKMDVKLGGLGPDYEAVREKSEKIKQRKEYAKHVQEHNMKNIANSRKPPPRPENKSQALRQKALEYAKTIPKPKLLLSHPSEPEPKEEKPLARTLNGENLPPISSLESLQNRHEKEKQVVAAFKTLHIV